MRIAVDAMGGDHAPEEVVRGVVEAIPSIPEATLLLVGQEDRLRELLKTSPVTAGIQIVPAREVIAMDENPARGLRGKPDSSLRVALELVKQGRADAIISAGNTGALVGGATVRFFGLGSLEGVKRPGIAIPLPTDQGCCALIDVGANKECKPIHLVQYAVMGSVYIKHLRRELTHPRVALLNIGEEPTKGTDLIKATYAALEKSNLNFIGNIEPHQMFSGKADVVVCDGFTGNLVLKMGEGLSRFILKQFDNGLVSLPQVQSELLKIHGQMDYSEYGGAPVLGIRGIVIKAHGRSKARAITNAVKVTAEFIRHKLNDDIVDEIKKLSMWGRLKDWWATRAKEESD